MYLKLDGIKYVHFVLHASTKILTIFYLYQEWASGHWFHADGKLKHDFAADVSGVSDSNLCI